ncbi:hypothetical protein V5O48_012543, partial [Marasmius crinis-equi]
KTRDDTFTDIATYPDWLFTYADFAHTAPIPLGLFTRENLEYINSSRHLIHFEKQTLSGSKSSVRVVDMAKLCKDRNVSMKDTENLTITQFSYAADRWWAFEAEREKRHSVPLHATWAGKHLAAWESFPERESTFAIWKPKELEQRSERYSKSLAFNNLDYMRARDRVLNTYELERKLVEEREKSERDPKRRRISYEYEDRDNELDSMSNGDKATGSRDPCCLLCAKRGHTSRQHEPSHGPALWARVEGTKIANPSTKRLICTSWNIYVNKVCSTACTFEHACTFCGSTSHKAFSWSCMEQPSD